MGYLVYLVGLVILVLSGVGLDKVCNFADMISLGFVVIPCLLVLVCMGYWKGFIRAFIRVFTGKEYMEEEIENSIKAVKLTCVCSLIFGISGVIISVVNLIRSMDPAGNAGAGISVAFITIFYALIINAVLVPLYFKLK